MNEKVIKYYESYDEDNRLFRDNLHTIEWITSIHYLKKQIPPESHIYDGCAGTGNYAFFLAEMGHKVAASDIVQHNVEIIKKKQSANNILDDIFTGDICRISRYGAETFDAVLCMGAFYHLDEAGREKAMAECLRVLKPGGLLVISYINHAAVLASRMKDGLESMDAVLEAYETKTLDGIFLHTTPGEMEKLAFRHKAEIIKHISSDGLAYMYGSKIKTATKQNFKKYINLHLKTCEDKNLLGYSLHGLLFLKKPISVQ